MIEVASSRARRPCRVGEQRIGGASLRRDLFGSFVEPGQVPSRQLANRRVRPARDRQDAGLAKTGHVTRPLRHRLGHGDRDRPCGARGPVCRARARGGAVGDAVPFEHDVRVGARPPEPAYAGGRGMVVVERPGRRLGRHLQGQPIPVHLRVRRPEVQVFRDDPVLHRQDRLDDAGDARRRLQVSDIRLDRADQQGPLRIASPAVRRRRRLELDGVADRGPGAVRLQVVHLRGLDAGPRERRLDAILLRRPARHRQSRARPVLVERGAADHPPDPVPVRLGLVKALEHHDAAAFAPHVAVRGGVERRAPPVRRQHPGVRPQLQQSAGQDGVHAAREREVRFASLEPRHRLVHRHQRRRAGGVHRHRGPFQAQREGDAPDGGVEGGAGDGVEAGGGLGGIADVQDEVPVLVVADPRVDPGAAAPQPLGVHPRVLERPPARLQHQPLLRVEELRLHR